MPEFTLPADPHVLVLFAQNEVDTARSMVLVLSHDAMAYQMMDRHGASMPKPVYGRASVELMSTTTLEEEVFKFIRNLETARWRASLPHFFFEAEPDWLAALARGNMHPKILDAVSKYLESLAGQGIDIQQVAW
jgi:hypothetical protein